MNADFFIAWDCSDRPTSRAKRFKSINSSLKADIIAALSH